MSFAPIFLLWLIPTRTQVTKVQDVIAYMEEIEKKVEDRDFKKMDKLKLDVAEGKVILTPDAEEEGDDSDDEEDMVVDQESEEDIEVEL